uniref:YL1_C domain-containing protein n=1 Tax=Globodera pallida TaxID=36090 RepID=A0A183BLP7_GLOPA
MFEAEKSNGTNAAAFSPPAGYKVAAKLNTPPNFGPLRNSSTIDFSAKKYKFKGPRLVDRYLYKFVPADAHIFKQLVATAVLMSLFSTIGRIKR